MQEEFLSSHDVNDEDLACLKAVEEAEGRDCQMSVGGSLQFLGAGT